MGAVDVRADASQDRVQADAAAVLCEANKSNREHEGRMRSVSTVRLRRCMEPRHAGERRHMSSACLLVSLGKAAIGNRLLVGCDTQTADGSA